MALETATSLLWSNHGCGRDSSGRFIGQIAPSYVAQGCGWTRLNTLGVPIAQETFGGLVRVRIERHHLPGASLETHFAAYTLVDVNNTGIRRGLHDDRVIRAGVRTWHRMRALFA